MTDRELMQMALDALDSMSGDEFLCNAAHHKKKDMHEIGQRCPVAERYKATREAIRARLEQPEPEELGEVIPADEEQLKRIAKLVEPEQEPVAWKRPVYMVEDGWDEFGFTDSSGDDVPLYTAPPQRKWQGLTDEPIGWIYEDDEGRIMFTQVPQNSPFWDPVYKAKNA